MTKTSFQHYYIVVKIFSAQLKYDIVQVFLFCSLQYVCFLNKEYGVMKALLSFIIKSERFYSMSLEK